MEEDVYRVDLVWKTSREGEISSPVVNESIEVATPPEFSKGSSRSVTTL